MLQNLVTLNAAAGADYSGIIMIVALFAIMYFLMIRPQQKKQKEIKKFRDGLTKGDKIITAGGIYGRIREINDKDNSMLISIDDNVTVRIDKGSVYPSPEEIQPEATKK